MNDKKILEEVYQMLQTNCYADWDENDPCEEFKNLKSFIEQEWQKADEERQDHGLEGSSYDTKVIW